MAGAWAAATPAADHPVGRWFRPLIAERLAGEGLATLGAAIDVDIDIDIDIDTTDPLVAPSPAVEPVRGQLVPLMRLAMPHTVSSAQAANRARRRSRMSPRSTI